MTRKNKRTRKMPTDQRKRGLEPPAEEPAVPTPGELYRAPHPPPASSPPPGHRSKEVEP